MTQSIRIDLFTDIVCPWCLIGTARLDQALAELEDTVTVEVFHHPFLLDPSTPENGQNTTPAAASRSLNVMATETLSKTASTATPASRARS